ncbi:MAG: lysine exporter LysO family protein [Paraprevotella sp.]|nr:lysine exporter LysO family protein [Paraprevotella sp.]
MSGKAPAFLLTPYLPMIILSLLILQVGIGLGHQNDLHALLRSFNWRMLLLPVFTIGGTLFFSGLAQFVFPDFKLDDLLAVSSGFGFYSLSSVLIAEIKTAAVGLDQATQLATIALLTNIQREMIALFGCAFFTRRGSGLAAISVAGINSLDVCLPSILHASGSKDLLTVAIFHGIALEISVPLLISFFCCH